VGPSAKAWPFSGVTTVATSDMKTRIMYIERKVPGTGDTGPARIGRVHFSKRGRTIYYAGKAFQSLKGAGVGGNYADVETGEVYWISGPKKDGTDRHWLARQGEPVEIDDDVRLEYWTEIRAVPERRHETLANR
jgi:hypothetical protein